MTGAGVVRSRLQAAAVRGLTRFVGRQPELETLQQALVQAQAGRARWWPSSGKRVLESPAWYTRWCTLIARRDGWCSKPPRCRMVRPRRIPPWLTS